MKWKHKTLKVSEIDKTEEIEGEILKEERQES